MALPPFTDRDYFFDVPILTFYITSGFIGGISFSPNVADIVVSAANVIDIVSLHSSALHDF